MGNATIFRILVTGQRNLRLRKDVTLKNPFFTTHEQMRGYMGNNQVEGGACSYNNRSGARVAEFAKQPSLFSPLEQVDGRVAKAALATLIVLDKVSFISPVRWFLPTASGDGTKLVGGIWSCSGVPPSSPSAQDGSKDTGGGCSVDSDCRSPRICKGGQCSDPPTLPKNNADAGAPQIPQTQCESNDIRSCGPCEIGFQLCNQDGLWDSACNYVQDQLTRYCYTGPAGTYGIGECHSGTQYCSKNNWSSCEGEVTPHPEICDNKDNDCDGEIDNGTNGTVLKRDFYPGPQGTKDVGICKGAEQYCSNGDWVTSNNGQPALPQTETCNGEDDNCDGRTDETGCGDKIGDACREWNGINSFDCLSGECILPSFYPNGYCTDVVNKGSSEFSLTECDPGHNFRKAVCVQNSQLGVDTSNFAIEGHLALSGFDDYFCVVTCDSDADCRTSEEYVCKTIQGSALKACLPQHEDVTIGTGACASVNP